MAVRSCGRRRDLTEIADGDAIPEDLRQQAKDMGLFGYAIPQKWGGLDLAQDVELAMEFGYTSLAVRSMFGTNNGIAGQVLVPGNPLVLRRMLTPPRAVRDRAGATCASSSPDRCGRRYSACR